MPSKKTHPTNTIGFATQLPMGLLDSKPSRKVVRKPSSDRSVNGDIAYDLPMPTKALVDQINALAPNESEFTVLEG